MMTDKQKKVKHWSERLVAFLSLVAIVAVVVTDNGMELWAKSPPAWLHATLGAIALGITTEEIKDKVLQGLDFWIKAKFRGTKE